MSTSEYAQKVVMLIAARPDGINLDQLLYEIYVRAKITEARRDREKGEWSSHDEVMEEMWRRIDSKFDGRRKRKSTSGQSSTRSQKQRQ